MILPRLALFLSFCVASAALLPAQDLPFPKGMKIAIHGEVRFAQGGGGAENVLVRLEAASGGLIAQVLTDRTGKFSFEGISQALYRVTASFAGFHTTTQEVNLTTTPNEHIILTLVPEKPGQVNQATPVEDTIVDTKAPKKARDEYEMGRAMVLTGKDPAKGIPHLENAVRIYPNFLQAQLLLGNAYLDAHKPDKAEAALKRVLEISPKTFQAHLALGEIYRMSKRYPEAEQALSQGLQLNDTSWQGHLSLGRLYLDMGDVAKAGPEIDQSLLLNPKNAETYLIAGNLQLKANRAEEALQMFEQYLQLEPKGQYADAARKVVEKLKMAISQKKK